MVRNGEFRKCLFCNIDFYAKRAKLREGKGKYCSKDCHYKDKREKPNKICMVCKVEFHARPRDIKVNRAKYCSHRCQGQALLLGEYRNCLNCNTQFYATQAFIRDNSGKYCSHKCWSDTPRSEETRRKQSLARKGDKSSTWKGGISSVNRLIRASFEYKFWREKVFKRDNYTCIWCGASSGQGKTVVLNADHIKPFALYPKLRFKLSNGQTLCVPCHHKTDTFGSKMRSYSPY